MGEFFAVCQENHTRLKLQKCEFMQETMQYLGFDVGYGWWTPAASKAKPLMHAKVLQEDPKRGLHDVRSFIGACNFYRRHIKNFTYTSAILTNLIKKSTTPMILRAKTSLYSESIKKKFLDSGSMFFRLSAPEIGGSS